MLSKIMVGGFLVLVLAVLSLYHSLDLQALYDQQCQMTCMEYDVDKLRTDFWDLRLLRFQLCSLGNVPKCSNRYRFKKMLQFSLLRKSSEGVIERFEISSDLEDNFRTYIDLKNKTDFFEIHQYIHVSFIHKTEKIYPNTLNSHFRFDHRRVRFLYYDFLDLGVGDNERIKKLACQVDITSECKSPEKEELWNILILFVIKMMEETLSKEQQINNETENVSHQKPVSISIGTNMFDQNTVLFMEGSKYYSWFSTVVCIWSLLIIFYFVWKMLTSIHGFTEKFSVGIAYIFGNWRESRVLTRPDLICVGTGDLNIFRSYFYSTVFGGLGSYSALRFVVFFIVWFLSITAFFNLLRELITLNKTICILLWIICSMFSLLLTPVAIVFLLCFSLIMFTPDLVIPISAYDLSGKYSIVYMLTNYKLSNDQFYIIVVLSIHSVMPIVLFYFDKWFLDLLLKRNLVHRLLWPTWPVQLIVSFAKKVKDSCSLSDMAEKAIWFVLVLILFFLGIFVVPQNNDEKQLSYDPKYYQLLGYSLFFPIYFILITFCNCYEKFISLAIEAVFTTLCIAYLCNFFLPWLYPSLKLFKDKDLLLYAILALTLVTYLLKIYREWYGIYDKFLKDVVSYVRNRYTCNDNEADLEGEEDSIALVCNHIDNGACQHLSENQGHVIDSQYKIKGLLILMKYSRLYVPSDFFFKVIKIPGAPGAVKSVVAKELLTLVLLRLFPAVFIYWLCHVIYLADFENYNLVITAVLGTSFVNQYKELFLYRNTSVVDVNGNIAFQREIEKFLRSYGSWFFISLPVLKVSFCDRPVSGVRRRRTI